MKIVIDTNIVLSALGLQKEELPIDYWFGFLDKTRSIMYFKHFSNRV